jgi:hypothetical protein
MPLPESDLLARYYAIKLRLRRDVGDALDRLSPDRRKRSDTISQLILAADKKSTRAAKKGLVKA